MCFCHGSGPNCDYLQARDFIARMFINVNQDRSADIYPHFTCATDTENIKFVFDVVKNHILQQHIVEVIPGLWHVTTYIYTVYSNSESFLSHSLFALWNY